MSQHLIATSAGRAEAATILPVIAPCLQTCACMIDALALHWQIDALSSPSSKAVSTASANGIHSEPSSGGITECSAKDSSTCAGTADTHDAPQHMTEALPC